MKVKGKNAVSIIGGSDGPTSVFIAGKSGNIFRRMRNEVRRNIHRRKKKKILSNLKAEPHSLYEVVSYIKEKYGAVELSKEERIVQESYKCMKSALVNKLQPDLLGKNPMEYCPDDFSDRDAVLRFLEISREFNEKAANIPDDIFPMDYHYYMIEQEGIGSLNFEVDFTHDFMGAGYTSKKGKRKFMDKIMKDIYLYYGVTADDIKNNSERLQSLLATLTAD